MPESNLTSLLPARVRVARLTGAGRTVAFSADAEARVVLAERLGILGVDALEVELSVTPFRGGFRVAGRLKADVRQQCVVTLEPVPESIDEPIDRVFLPGAEPETGAEVYLDPEAEDEPDWFEGEYLDLVPLIVETLSLALDPYPRAPGAEMEAADAGQAAEESPFSALKRLKENG